MPYVLTELPGLASSVSVDSSDSQLDVEIRSPRLHQEDTWYYRCPGGPIASIVAAISSEALGKPVRMEEEVDRQGRSSIALEVLPLRTYGRYVASLVMSVCLANVLLAVSDRDDLAIYTTVNIMVYPVISLLTAYTDPGARMTLATAGTVLFGCSMAVVILKAVGTSPGR